MKCLRCGTEGVVNKYIPGMGQIHRVCHECGVEWKVHEGMENDIEGEIGGTWWVDQMDAQSWWPKGTLPVFPDGECSET